MILDSGFDVRQIADLVTYTAYAGVFTAGRNTFDGDSSVPGTYGVWIAGGGTLHKKWGAGKSTFDDGLRAAAVVAALRSIPPHAKLMVFTKGLTGNVGKPDGHYRAIISRCGYKADNKTAADSYEDMKSVIEAMDEDRLSITSLGKRETPQGIKRADSLARDMEPVAKAYSVLHESYDRNAILATDEDPDPAQLMRYTV